MIQVLLVQMRSVVALQKRCYSAKQNAFPQTEHERSSRDADKGGLEPSYSVFCLSLILLLSFHQIRILASSSAAASSTTTES